MKSNIRTLFVFGFLLSTLLACSAAGRHFWEISSPDLPHIAMIRADPRFGSVVVYNSELCKQIGDACGFFRTHAHAHSSLSHQILPPGGYPDSLEAEADCWAARNAEPGEVTAAVQLLSDENRDPDIPIIGNASERAERIRDCAIESRNWIEQT